MARASGPPPRWKVRQHGASQRRTWRKLHLAFEEATNEILATQLTTNAVDDASMLKPLLEVVTQPVAMLGADGAYDRVKVYDELALRQIRPLIPPRVNARIWPDEAGVELAHARNEAIRAIEAVGLAGWKQAVGYHRRRKAETGIYRWKTIFGGQLQSRLLANQQMEVQLKAACTNRFNRLGLPKAVKRDST